MINIKNLIFLSIIFLALDTIYLSISSAYFRNLVKTIQGGKEMKFRLIPAVFCYMFLIFSLYYFIINKNGNELDAFLLGLSIYGVFETTNAAIFEDWELNPMIFDTIWGGILYLLTTFIFKKLIE